ncbi:efflux RND transporter periplasmic adaptor subunit [Neptunomonas japonica]|uniref:RND family efflux transporter MFP subunit n=1 Tax=Neptunomonas japonica JAMM 1380 TaxID=1441457 RepID=A0A7R6PWY5_9GAMM|nr:HlyD family efflux transporter periplasmic adaptor subunit [Neptunomonas japonica]BBB31063.1 RND family efflux transporter MFP subunit [Neptunomonas japonica JAMM 1380]
MSTAVNQKKTRHLTWILPLLVMAVAIGAFLALKSSKPQTPSRPALEKSWSVQTQTVSFSTIRPEVVLYGQVESVQMTQLSASVTAFVESVISKEGQQVEKGDLLVKLDPRDTQLIVRQREADLQSVDAKLSAARTQNSADKKALNIEKKLYALASKSVSRYKDLSKRKVGSDDQLDTARKNLQQQALALNNREQAINAYPSQLAQLKAEQEKIKALRDSALLDLERTSITAPFKARISSIKTATGDRVKSGDPLITLYDPTQLQLRSQIPSKTLPWVRQGLLESEDLKATAVIDKQTITLNLSHLASSVSNGNTGVDALLQFTPEQFIPEPGRTLSLTLFLPEIDNVITIPPSALYGTDRVYRVRDAKLESVIVSKVGDAHDDNGSPLILIQPGDLQAGDSLIITQLPNAISGLPVKATE